MILTPQTAVTGQVPVPAPGLEGPPERPSDDAAQGIIPLTPEDLHLLLDKEWGIRLLDIITRRQWFRLEG